MSTSRKLLKVGSALDIGDDLLEDGLLDLEDDLLDVETYLLQELDLGTSQAATPAARPVSRTGALSQADSGYDDQAVSLDQGTRPYKERPPLRARCKLVVCRAREIRRFKRCWLPCRDSEEMNAYPQFESKLYAKLQVDEAALGGPYEGLWYAFGRLKGKAAQRLHPWMEANGKEHGRITDNMIRNFLNRCVSSSLMSTGG